jgi:hypothetical protein
MRREAFGRSFGPIFASTPNVFSPTFCLQGPKALSEPETRAFSDYVSRQESTFAHLLKCRDKFLANKMLCHDFDMINMKKMFLEAKKCHFIAVLD